MSKSAHKSRHQRSRPGISKKKIDRDAARHEVGEIKRAGQVLIKYNLTPTGTVSDLDWANRVIHRLSTTGA